MYAVYVHLFVNIYELYAFMCFCCVQLQFTVCVCVCVWGGGGGGGVGGGGGGGGHMCLCSTLYPICAQICICVTVNVLGESVICLYECVGFFRHQ